MTLSKTHSMGQGNGRNGQGDECLVVKGRNSWEDQRKRIPANSGISSQISNYDFPGEKLS